MFGYKENHYMYRKSFCLAKLTLFSDLMQLYSYMIEKTIRCFTFAIRLT